MCGNALEVATRHLSIEREQLVETVRGIRVDRIRNAVFQFRAILGNLTIGRLAILTSTLRVAQHIADITAIDIGICKVGIELDRLVVIVQSGFKITQLGVQQCAIVVNQNVLGRVVSHLVVVLQRTVVVANLRAHDSAVEVGERVCRVELDRAVEICQRFDGTIQVRMNNCSIEERNQIARIALNGLIEIDQSLFVLLLCHQQRTATIVAVGVLAVGANCQIVVVVSRNRILQIEVACTAIDVGINDLRIVANEHIEILDRLLELLVQQARNATAVIGVREVGT